MRHWPARTSKNEPYIPQKSLQFLVGLEERPPAAPPPLPLSPVATFLYPPGVRCRLLALLWLVAAPVAFAQAPSSPNILLIVADDVGYHDLGMQGSTNFPTPRIDALAAGGVRFTSGYACGAVCSPTRASIMTGRYQQRFGHESNPPAPSPRGLPTNEVTFASALKSAGLRHRLCWQMASGRAGAVLPYGSLRGFDSFVGFLGPARRYWPIASPASFEVISSNGVALAETGYTTDRFGQAATNFIHTHADQPWFLYLCFNAVHSPLDADPARINRLTNYTYSSP